jgi:hypothetical protein
MVKPFIRIVVFLSTFSALGCVETAQLQAESAGHVGCSPDQVGIGQHKVHWSHHTWIAICGDRVFTCSIGSVGVSSCAEIRD